MIMHHCVGFECKILIMKVAIAGASGFAGAELIKICTRHSELELVAVFAESSAGLTVRESHAGLSDVDLAMISTEKLLSVVDDLAIEVVFLALPHGASQDYVPQLLERELVIVDLGADYRLKDPGDYKSWYGVDHRQPELLERAVYGLVEFNRDRLKGSKFIAAPGCYVTAASLAIKPLIDESLVLSEPVIVDAASGVSGAGRTNKSQNMFMSIAENFSAYGLKNHRHTVEIETNTNAKVLFTPHLAPMTRGILATCYLRPTHLIESLDAKDADELLASCYRRTFAGDTFVGVESSAPSTRSTYGTNKAKVFATFDPRTNWVIAFGALDNLVKGAAGQAVQALNVALGFDESLGLNEIGVWP